MASGAIIKDKLMLPINMTVADANAIEKGQLLHLIDPRTVSGANRVNLPCAGILAREKISGDGRTQVAVYRKGIFDLPASGAIIAGEGVRMAEAGYVMKAGVITVPASGAIVLGHALETATDKEYIQISLDL